jgi:hypothetical protein
MPSGTPSSVSKQLVRPPLVLGGNGESRPGDASKLGLCSVNGLIADLRAESQTLRPHKGDVGDADEAEHGAQVGLLRGHRQVNPRVIARRA